MFNENQIHNNMSTEVSVQTVNPCASVPFVVEEWDEKASLSPHHLSYIISILLPKRLVSLDRDINIESQLKAFCEENHITNAVPVGSSSEGFNIPYSMSIEVDSTLKTNTDADILFVEKDFQISTIDSIQDSEVQAKMESENTHPGYTRVCLQKYDKDPRDVITLNGKKYLNGQEIQKRMHKKVDITSSDNDQTFISIHGPAVSVEHSTVLNAENIQTHGIRIALDMVLAVQVGQWPLEARKWVERAKQAKWLGDALVESIVSKGCHVVPVAHKRSQNPDVEWRISFSTTEKQIAKKCRN